MLVNDCDSKYQREHRVWGYLGLTFPKAHSWGCPPPTMHWSPWRSWSPASSAEVASGSSPVTPNQTVLSEIQSPLGKGWTSSPGGSLVGKAHSSLWGNRVPSKVQAPHAMQQHLGYTQAAGVRYYGAGAQQPKCLANKLPFIRCRNSKLRLLAAVKVSEGKEMFLQWAGLSTTSWKQGKDSTCSTITGDFCTRPFLFSHFLFHHTRKHFLLSYQHQHTEYVTQQLNKLNQAF